MSKKEIDEWEVHGMTAVRFNSEPVRSVEIVNNQLRLWLNWECSRKSSVSVDVLAVLLRNAGYTVTEPTQPDCCGRGCGECEEDA